MEKVTRNSLTKREIEIMILGEISSQTKCKYDETKHFILQTFEKEGIEKIKNESIYNLQGQRINALQKGLNIVEGKKLLDNMRNRYEWESKNKNIR